MMGIRLNIDDEFRALIPPLTTEELEGLEADIKENGCRDPLKVWLKSLESGLPILLDGHNRYEICERLGISWSHMPIKGLADRNEAKIWVIRNQLNRRNLSMFARAELALKLEPLFAAKAKANQQAGGGSGISGRQISAQPSKTRDAVAKSANVSHDTIAKVKVLAARASDETKAKLRRGESTINREHKAIVGADSGSVTEPRGRRRAACMSFTLLAQQQDLGWVITLLEALERSHIEVFEELADSPLDDDVRRDLVKRLARVLASLKCSRDKIKGMKSAREGR